MGLDEADHKRGANANEDEGNCSERDIATVP
jgi:hypothetical protein